MGSGIVFADFRYNLVLSFFYVFLTSGICAQEEGQGKEEGVGFFSECVIIINGYALRQS